MQGGYSVANGMKEAIHYLQHGELHIDEVSGIFICSDGLFHPDWSLEQAVAYIRKNSISEYVAIIEKLEGEKRIRPDDKTMMMIDFKEDVQMEIKCVNLTFQDELVPLEK